MMKTILLLGVAATMILTTSTASPKETYDFVGRIEIDSIEVDTVDFDYVDDTAAIVDTVAITQYDLNECDGIHVCPPSKYAIVTKNGMQGVYDMTLGQTITDLEYQEIIFSRVEETEEGTKTCWFYVKKDHQFGIHCVYENDNSIMSIWMSDSDEVVSEE